MVNLDSSYRRGILSPVSASQRFSTSSAESTRRLCLPVSNRPETPTAARASWACLGCCCNDRQAGIIPLCPCLHGRFSLETQTCRLLPLNRLPPRPANSCWCWTSGRSTRSSLPAACASSTCTARSCGTISRPSESQELAPKGIILSGGPASVYETERAALRSADLPAGHSRAGHLLRHATGLPGARRQGGQLTGPRVRPGAVPRHVAGGPVRRLARRDRRLDEPRRPGDRACRTTSSRWRRRTRVPIAAVKHRSLPIYGVQFHPEVTHTPQGTQVLAQFPHARLRLPGDVEAGRFRRGDDRQHSQARGQRAA